MKWWYIGLYVYIVIQGWCAQLMYCAQIWKLNSYNETSNAKRSVWFLNNGQISFYVLITLQDR